MRTKGLRIDVAAGVHKFWSLTEIKTQLTRITVRLIIVLIFLLLREWCSCVTIVRAKGSWQSQLIRTQL